MLNPKFIIEGDKLVLGKVVFHKHLVTTKGEHKNIKGGGWFRYDFDNDAFILSGQSVDFGPAKLSDIRLCVENNRCYTSVGVMSDSPLTSKFKYDIGSEIIDL